MTRGDLSCYVDENNQAWIEWTEENLLIYSFASGRTATTRRCMTGGVGLGVAS